MKLSFFYQQAFSDQFFTSLSTSIQIETNDVIITEWFWKRSNRSWYRSLFLVWKKTFPDLNPRRYLVLEYLLQAEKDAPVSHLQIAIQRRPAWRGRNPDHRLRWVLKAGIINDFSCMNEVMSSLEAFPGGVLFFLWCHHGNSCIIA